ncbi:MAG TPA: BamA/TamA family outer membrane protein [Polyangiaceae bacterium]|nr:BamA/TamA family outer membrane protein [Polyangiaceae bacterium]
MMGADRRSSLVRLARLGAFLVVLPRLAHAQAVPPPASPPTNGGEDQALPEAPPSPPAPEPSAEPSPAPSAPPPPTAFDAGSSAPAPSPTAPPAACDCDGEHAERASSRVRYELEGISVRGNTRTNRRVVMRYVPFKPGDIIDVNNPAFELLRYRLLGTGFFREVELSLEKGSRRGQVLLVIEVSERNTIVVNDVWMGLSKDADVQGLEKGQPRPLTAYAGLDVAETNLAGTGITLGGAAAFAQYQLGLRLHFLDPAFLGSKWMVAGTLLYNNAHDFFGNAKVKQAGSPQGEGELTDYAIVAYRRLGGTLGFGRDLSVSTQVWAHYRLEAIDADYPKAASHQRGFDREPIDFNIIRGKSWLSTVRATLQHDTRDQPFLPTHGWLVTLNGEFSLLPTAISYSYQKVEAHATHFWQLPWHGDVVSLDLYGGAIAGNAPFFEQFYVGDLSDFLPDRVLGMNFDRRPPPNFFGTQIVEERYGDYAFKILGEYRLQLYRGQRSIYGIDAFAGAGIYGLANARTFSDPPTGYSGLARIPIDFTATLGIRADTAVGGFTFSLSNALGFAFTGKGPAGQQGSQP